MPTADEILDAPAAPNFTADQLLNQVDVEGAKPDLFQQAITAAGTTTPDQISFEQYRAQHPTEWQQTASRLYDLADTPEKKDQLAKFIMDKSAPELPASGTAGQVVDAVTTGPFTAFGDVERAKDVGQLQADREQQRQDYNQKLAGFIAKGGNAKGFEPEEAPSKVERLAQGVGNSLMGTVDFADSPFGVIAAGLGSVPEETALQKPVVKLLQKGMALGFGAQMAAAAPNEVAELYHEVSKPTNERDWAKIGELTTGLVTTPVFAGLAFKHGLRSDAEMAYAALNRRVAGTRFDPQAAAIAQLNPRLSGVAATLPSETESQQFEQEVTPEGSAPNLTQGRVLPVNTQRLPVRVEPGPVEVPETPAEPDRDVNVIQQIRQAGATTIAQIQKLFPNAGLNREAARALRDQAFPPGGGATLSNETAEAPAEVDKPESADLGLAGGAQAQAPAETWDELVKRKVGAEPEPQGLTDAEKAEIQAEHAAGQAEEEDPYKSVLDPAVQADMHTLNTYDQRKKYGMSSADVLQAQTLFHSNNRLLAEGEWPNGKKLTDADRKRFEAENKVHAERLEQARQLRVPGEKSEIRNPEAETEPAFGGYPSGRSVDFPSRQAAEEWVATQQGREGASKYTTRIEKQGEKRFDVVYSRSPYDFSPEAVKSRMEALTFNDLKGDQGRWEAIENTYRQAKAAQEALPGVPLKDAFLVTIKSGPYPHSPIVDQVFVPRDKLNEFTKASAEAYPPGKFTQNVQPGSEPYKPRKGEPSFKDWLAGKRPDKEISPAKESHPATTGPTTAAQVSREEIGVRPGEKTWLKGKVGGSMRFGEVVLTSSGRKTTPFPTVKKGGLGDVRKIEQWLKDNAVAEAQARGDDYNARIFASETGKDIPPASKASMEEYLFGEQPAVVPKILKPLTGEKQPENKLETKPSESQVKPASSALSADEIKKLSNEEAEKAWDDRRVDINDLTPAQQNFILNKSAAAIYKAGAGGEEEPETKPVAGKPFKHPELGEVWVNKVTPTHISFNAPAGNGRFAKVKWSWAEWDAGKEIGKPAEPETAGAVGQVQEHVQQTAQAEGERSAKEIKSELVDRVEKALATAPSETDLGIDPKLREEFNKEARRGHGDSQLKSLVQALTKAKAKRINISIPDDGNFTVWNTKEALSYVLKYAKRVDTKPNPKQELLPGPPPLKGTDFLQKSAQDAINTYGNPLKAKQVIEKQLAEAGDEMTPEDRKRYADVAEILESTAYRGLQQLRKRRDDLQEAIEANQMKADAITPEELKQSSYAKPEKGRYLSIVKARKEELAQVEQNLKAEEAKVKRWEESVKPAGGVKAYGGGTRGRAARAPLLKPALLVNGEPLTGGDTHAEILHNLTAQAASERNPDLLSGALDAFGDDAKHVFVDQDGNVYDRRQAAQAMGKEGELHSEDLLSEPAEGVKAYGGGKARTVPQATTPAQLATIQRNMMPGYNVLQKSAQGVLSLLLPSAKSKAHLTQAEILGSKIGAMNRLAESAVAMLSPHNWKFNKLGLDNPLLTGVNNPGLKFMGDMSAGRPVDPRFADTATLVTKLFDRAVDRLTALGRPLAASRANYFPGMWTAESRAAFNAALIDAQTRGLIPKDFDVNTATPAMRAAIKALVDEYIQRGEGSEVDALQYLSRRPLKGKESFRKKKLFDDITEAMEFGLRPISTNPIDLVRLKLSELHRAIMGEDYLHELRQRGELKTISPYEQVPDGWVKLNDRYGTIYGPPTTKLTEWLDKNVYEGLNKFANSLGIRHERTTKFPPGKHTRALGLSYTGQNFVRTKFGTETSVLAHEIGHQIDDRYDFWNLVVNQAEGKTGARGKPTKGGNAKAREEMRQELRNIADMTGRSTAYSRQRDEQIAQMFEAYVHAPERMKAVAPMVYNRMDTILASKPELAPLRDIKPGIELVKNQVDKYVGLPIMGYRIIPKEAADIVNNYLSSSLYNSEWAGSLPSNVYKGWMAAANALNQSQLGLGSAFHVGFTIGETQISAGANLFKDIYGVWKGNRSASDLGRTAKDFATAIVETPITGDRVLNAWRNPDAPVNPRIRAVVKAAELAGGGFKMEHGMRTEQFEKMVRDWLSQSLTKRGKAILRTPLALTEVMAKPIMDWIVPRQKAGVFAHLVGRIIEQNPGKSMEDLRPQFRQAWNRIDARLGQVRYNRLFTNTMAKEILQATVRAPGWSGGTIAELGGAFPDAAKFFAEWAKTGKLPENIPDRVAYTVSLLLGVTLTNGVLTYAFTGTMPHGLDYMAFRDGHKNKDGTEARFLLPTYMKDILAYARHPYDTFFNKAHPAIGVMRDVYNNRDYYGYEIRDPDAPAGRQVGQVGKYVLKAFEPFWIQGEVKANDQKASALGVLGPVLGVMPAPASQTLPAIREEINARYATRRGSPTKPYAQRETDAQKLKTYDPTTTDIWKFRHLPRTDQEELASRMSPEERQRYMPSSALSE